jgi:cardiolipin synthase
MGHSAHPRTGRLGLVLLLAAGCQSPPPAHPNACQPTAVPRPVLIAGQVARDTVVAVSAHPGRSARAAVTEPLGYLRAWFDGLAQKRIALKFMGPPPPIEPDRPTLDVDRLEEDARRISGTTPCPADVRLYTDGCTALAALDEVIAGARCRLDVLMYLWGNDAIGWREARQLAARAGPELPVRVLVDGGGNFSQGEPRDAPADEVNRTVCWLARQPYVTLVRTRNANFRFDHRKLVVADGRIAWSGGRNFVDSAFNEYHDVSYTVGGPLAARLAAGFEEFWHGQGGSPALPVPAPTPPEVPNALARLVSTRSTDRSLAHLLYDAVERAEHHIYIENPYFSDSHLIYLLAKSRRRGADVRAVLTLKSDSPIYDRSNRVTANRLLRAGVRVYLYPGVTHVKALAVDGVWAYTGTGNFDSLSLRHNRELGLAITAGPAIQQIEEQLFLPDLCPEWELTEPLPLSPLDYLYEFIASSTA